MGLIISVVLKLEETLNNASQKPVISNIVSQNYIQTFDPKVIPKGY